MTTPPAVGSQGTFYKFKAVHGSLAPNRTEIADCWINDSSPDNRKYCTAYTGQTEPMEPSDWPTDATKCLRHINLDSRYCTQHLYEIEKLSIDVSDHLSDMGIYGLGLYYGKRIIKDRIGEKPVDFEDRTLQTTKKKNKGNINYLTKYVGKMSNVGLQADKWDFVRADGETELVTNPYALTPLSAGKKLSSDQERKKPIIDSSCTRSAGVYANSSNVMHHINAKLIPTLQNSRIVSTKKLVYGDEILILYDKKRARLKNIGKVTALSRKVMTERKKKLKEEENEYWAGVGPTHVLFATIMFGNGSDDKDIENVFQGRFDTIAEDLAPIPPAVKRGKREVVVKKRKAYASSENTRVKRSRR
jgi:hypothetical protein